jgi:hypothetical protein
MAPYRKKRAQSNRNKTKSSAENGERMICAVCGRIIVAGDETTPVIYSVCASCKRIRTGGGA